METDEDSHDSEDDTEVDMQTMASRDRKLRPRKEVSFNLKEMSATPEASEEAAVDVDSEAELSSGPPGNAKTGGKRKRKEKIAVVDDESALAQLVEMQPVRT